MSEKPVEEARKHEADQRDRLHEAESRADETLERAEEQLREVEEDASRRTQEEE